MNRLYFSNSALNSLNLARTYKNELMRLDRNLSALQAEIFMLKLKNELNFKLQLAQYEEQPFDKHYRMIKCNKDIF